MASRPPPGYERQVAARSAPLPFADPDAFGAGIGRGIQSLGTVIEKIAAREKAANEDAEMARTAASMSGGVSELKKAAVEARAKAGPGGAGHSEAQRAAFDDWSKKTLGEIKSERVRNWATQRLATERESFLDREDGYVAAAAAKRMGDDTQTFFEQQAADTATEVEQSGSLEAAGKAEEGLASYVEQLNNATPEQKKALLREGNRQIWLGAAGALKRANPSQLAALVKSGALNDVLTADDLDTLASEADVRVRRDALEAERAAAAVQKQQKAVEDTALQQVADGTEVPLATLKAMRQQAQARGDIVQADQLREAEVTVGIVAPLQNATSDQITRRIAEIEGDRNWKRSPDKVRAHNALTSLREKTRNGEANIPAPDWNDPAAIDAYKQAARADAAARGRPVRWLTPEMETDMRSRLTSAQGRMGVAEELARLGPGARLQAAQQLAPGDHALAGAVGLSPKVRELALAGPEYRKANPKLVPERDTQEAHGATIGRAIGHLGADFSAAHFETTRNIYASLIARNGGHGEKFDKDAWATAANMAAGATKRGGEWQGGIGVWNGRKVLLPTTMTQREFDAAMGAIGVIDGASNGPPAWGDGSPIQASQLRRDFRPVAIREGVYVFEHIRNGMSLKVKGSGQEWMLDIRRLRR